MHRQAAWNGMVRDAGDYVVAVLAHGSCGVGIVAVALRLACKGG
jgi:hypothetical protein